MNFVASCSDNRKVKLLLLITTGIILQAVHLWEGMVTYVDHHGDYVASCSDDGKVRLPV